jgi:hypothetical protein
MKTLFAAIVMLVMATPAMASGLHRVGYYYTPAITWSAHRYVVPVVRYAPVVRYRYAVPAVRYRYAAAPVYRFGYPWPKGCFYPTYWECHRLLPVSNIEWGYTQD